MKTIETLNNKLAIFIIKHFALEAELQKVTRKFMKSKKIICMIKKKIRRLEKQGDYNA